MPRKGRLDFERGVPKEARDTIAAMTMTRGGLIIHGVDNGRNIAGCPLSRNTREHQERSFGFLVGRFFAIVTLPRTRLFSRVNDHSGFGPKRDPKITL